MGFSSALRTYVLALAAVLVAIVALHAATRPAGVHLTQAELLVTPAIGYQPPPASADRATIPGAWQAVTLPHAARPAMAPSADSDATSVTWYHVRIPPLGARSGELYLYIPRWKSDGTLAIYVDGRLHYQSHANLQWNGSNMPLWIAFDETAGGAPPRDLLIRMQHVRGIGGALSSLWVGDYAQLGGAYLVRDFFQAELPYVTSAAFLVTGLFALLVWLRSRRETLYLLFFTVTVVTFLRMMHNYAGLERLPVSDAWFGWVTVNAVLWMLFNLHLFLLRIHRRPARWLTRLLGGLTIAAALVTLPLPANPIDATLAAPILYPTMLLVAAIACVHGLYWSWRVRAFEGAVLAAYGLAAMLLGVHDWLMQNNLIDIENLSLSNYAQIGLIFAFCHFALRRYTEAMREVRDANRLLEERLRAREAELVASHERLREIERRELLHEERQRLMQDMHDGMGSSLVSALRAAEQGRIEAPGVADLLRDCIDDLKLTIDSMEPVETDLLLLLGTLRFRLQPRLESAGIRLRWEVRDVPPLPWLDQRHALHILRILQEAFTNAVKHADASEITVATDCVDGAVRVRVADNGRGFDPAEPSRGRGLGNQARRAEGIGGGIEIVSGPAGTTTVLTLPMAKQPREAMPVARAQVANAYLPVIPILSGDPASSGDAKTARPTQGPGDESRTGGATSN